MRLLLINNIGAGQGDARTHDFIRTFWADGDEIVIRTTDGTTSVASLLHDADRFDAVVAAGGDGTVSSVLYELRNSNIPVLPYPAGTTNLLTRNLDSPIEPRVFADMVRRCETIDFDIGELELTDRTCGFMMIAGAGYDAHIMENAAKMKASLGKQAYFAAAMAEPNPKTSRFTLTLDGEVVQTEGIAVLLVNFGRLPLDISITPENDPRDGMIEVTVLKVSNTIQLLPALIAAMLDRQGGFPTRGDSMEIHLAHEVKVEADPALNIQYDGEPTGMSTPLIARSLKRSARIIVDHNSERIRRLEEKERYSPRQSSRDVEPREER